MIAFIAGMMFGSIGACFTLLLFIGARQNSRCNECIRRMTDGK